MKKTFLVVFILSVLFQIKSQAQDDSKQKSEKITSQDKRLLDRALGIYKDGDYIRALSIYKVLAESYPDNADIVYKTGICYLYKSDEKEKSIDYILMAAKINPKLNELNFNLGRAYHINYRFPEAITSFEAFINENPPIVKLNLAKHYLEFCKNGEALVASHTNMIIDNIGPPVNTENSEYVPIVNADQSILIFTYKGERSTGGLMDADLNPSPDGDYYEDVFISHKVGEQWTEPQSIGPNINTNGHDASIALSFDGKKLFIFRSTPKDGGDIYISLLKDSIWGVPVRLGPTINTKAWEGSASMSSDEQTLYFASERKGGLGGRDLYKANKQPDGEWGPAINLGAMINTQYDEDAPFIHPDGRTLFFSSKGHNSLGGYDIFYSILKDGEWSEPVNMGTPINTTDDDQYYVLTPDGETGYYSSNRKEGYGQQDIYVITPGLQGIKPILAMTSGQVLLDSRPVEASIKVLDADNDSLKANYTSNAQTGKYVVALPSGTNYKLAIEVAGNAPHYEYLNVKSLETFVQLQQDIQVYSEEYMKTNKIDSAGSNNLQKRLEEQLKKYNDESNAAIYEARIFKDLLKKRGDFRKDSITFNVNLGTYETASDFDPGLFAALGKADTIKNSSGSTTFLMGGFQTLAGADSMLLKINARDTTFIHVSAITVNAMGKNKLLQDYFAPYYDRKDYKAPTELALIKTRNNPELKERREAAEPVKVADPVAAVQTVKVADTVKVAEPVKIADTVKVAEPVKAAEPVIAEQPVKAPEPAKTISAGEPTICDTNRTYSFSALAGKSLNNPAVYSQLLKLAGSMCVEGLTFRVQVGAFRHPENFRSNQLKPLGYAVDRSDVAGDGIVRFAVGEFKMLKDTEKLRQKAIGLGTKDAWITAVYNGKRMTLEELIPLNFYTRGLN